MFNDTIRPRRLRTSDTLRRMVRETRVSADSLIWPLFVVEGEGIYRTLNGEWRFAFFENGDKAGNIEEWETIEVPACWQTKGYENPNYTNINYCCQ